MSENEEEFGYCRCSTNDTKQDISYQIKLLTDQGIKREKIYLEYESGAREDRPEFNKMLAQLKSGHTIRVSEITRLSRSTRQLCDVIDMVSEKKLRLVIGSLEVDCRSNIMDPMVEGMLKMMAVFAELERKMRSYQIKLGLRNAISKGHMPGRRKTDRDSIPEIFYRFYPLYEEGKLNKTEFARVTNLSYPTIYKYLKIVKESE